MTAKPNFFIVGAPKCGTTALAQYLSAHPNVYFSPVKEPHFFSDDFPGIRDPDNLDDYLALFSGAQTEHQAVGEASVSYFYSDVALKHIAEFDPDVRIIVMLRNPVEMVYSWHGQMLRTMNENLSDFSRAWEAQEERQAGRKIPSTCRSAPFLQYREIGMLGKYLQRVLSLFRRDQVHIIFLEDLQAEPDEVWSELLGFLGLPLQERGEFPRVNKHFAHRNRLIALFTERVALSEVGRGIRRVKRAVGLGSWKFGARLRKANVRVTPRARLPASLQDELRAAFSGDIRLLEQLTGRNLDHWRG